MVMVVMTGSDDGYIRTTVPLLGVYCGYSTGPRVWLVGLTTRAEADIYATAYLII
jgi:hypothetical protein